MTLQISILRHPSLRRQMVATLIVTVFCIIFVGVTYYYNKAILDWLNSFLSYLLGQHIILRLIGDWPWTYTFINFAIIAIFWVDTLRRWVRRARGKTPTRRVDLTTGEVTREYATADEPTMQELISGDLIAGAVLCLVLAVIFRDSVISFFSQALNVGINVQTCTVSWPIGVCTPPGGGLHDPPTLTFIDLIQALVYLPLGLLILAPSTGVSVSPWAAWRSRCAMPSGPC
jgi:membrane protein implicated in regulation of membrane protease activity